VTTTNDPGFGLPNFDIDVIDEQKRLTTQWQRAFTRLFQLTPERAISAVAPGPSPFTWSAFTIGHLLIAGGNVNAVTLTRGRVSIAVPTSGFIPVAAKDSVTITYSVAPTLSFVPGARA
jgi:hypothetical protein